MSREVVDLAGLARMVVDEDGWHDVEVQGSGTATVDSAMVARLLRNLLQHSAQHPSASACWVEVADGTLCVGDDGAGIPVERHLHVASPFERGASSAGHGLALSIVSEIAALPDGSVGFSAPSGLVVTVRFARTAES